ncbi:MAG: HEAT repeat domain-containing protein [bacterium]
MQRNATAGNMKRQRLTEKLRIMPVIFLAGAAFLAAGCGDEIDEAINLLGGDEAQQQEGLSAIRISGKDPLPKLRKALLDKDKPAAARKNVADILGAECEKAGGAAGERCAVAELEKALAFSEPGVQGAIVRALAKGKSESAVAALRRALDSGNDQAAGFAWEQLEKKADEKIYEAEKIDGPDAFERKEKLLKDAVGFNPRNRRVVALLASLYSYQGMRDRALELYDSAGEHVRRMMVIGPFPGNSKTPHPPEKELDFGASYPGKRREARWFEFNGVPENGEADFRRNRRTKTADAAFYASFTVTSPAAQDALMKLTGTDVVFVRIGNADVFTAVSHAAENRAQFDGIKTKVTLGKGENRVLVKIHSRKYPRFSIRFCTTDHKRLKRVKYGL